MEIKKDVGKLWQLFDNYGGRSYTAFRVARADLVRSALQRPSQAVIMCVGIHPPAIDRPVDVARRANGT